MAEGEVHGEERTEAELRRLAYRDYLTGLPNRIAMADRIEDALTSARREGGGAALLLVDIDGFKRVNDALGHSAGDELLKQIGERLARLGDSRVVAGRHGGDEFLLLVADLPFDSEQAARAVLEIGGSVLYALRQPFTVARSTFEISASIGASIFRRDASCNAELSEHADQAMYRAKRAGGARPAIYEPLPRPSVLALETTLRARHALQAGEFDLVYQPILEIADGRTLGGLEALLRWKDPDRGVLTPETFLPFLEHSSLLEEIGEWVFSRVCAQLSQWAKHSFRPRVSFNIPARQLRRPGFADFLIATAMQARAKPSRLALEITESSPVSLEEIRPTLEKLCEAGFVLSLDDFGTGYSSLARLRSMPFSLLKTDRSFMQGIPGDRVAMQMLEGVIALGATLGLKVIVEGVETPEQERELLRMGARVAQGYYLGSPASPEEIELRWGPSAKLIGRA